MKNIAEYQKATREGPHVWCVYVTCDGETDVVDIYDSKEAAEMHKDWQNKKSRYYGRASIGRMPVLTKELAESRFYKEQD